MRSAVQASAYAAEYAPSSAYAHTGLPTFSLSRIIASQHSLRPCAAPPGESIFSRIFLHSSLSIAFL